VKPKPVQLDGVTTEQELVERVVRTRLGEARRLASGLAKRDNQSLHDFRIACKRLRYALERFQALVPALAPAAERLAQLQDALGEAHDRDVLLSILPAAMVQTERRLRREREEYVNRASALWQEAQELARTSALILFE
jgi:CHAD domain-containing protein